ncbi:hypothetical protein ILUMI_24665 [Ignelater luminosus]|uniref:RanBP2-type domain-containing protein n=1 Tax=Ignelater luminosus TaxID=2038154 RepID=A0A8K0CBG7_IGNLU|nr:hypothetical protein ILUMI_24665 [Ignelater luminosus]
MGTIASVLQWHCRSCSLINPTEKLRCIRCGSQRQNNINKEDDITDSLSDRFGGSRNCTVIRRSKSIRSKFTVNRLNSEIDTRDCSTLVKNTIYNSLLLLQRATSLKAPRQYRRHLLRRYHSVPLLTYTYQCKNCQLIINSCLLKCLVCDLEEDKMNVAHSPCKNCVTSNELSLTPVEQPPVPGNGNNLYRSYDLGRAAYVTSRPCSCQHTAKTNFVSLSNIKSFSCATAQQSNCDSTMDGNKPSNVRTTSSGISYNSSKPEDGTSLSYKSNNYSWRRKNTPPGFTWTCKRCTLLNNGNSVYCEACESPFQPDFNSNISPSVLIKVIIS